MASSPAHRRNEGRPKRKRREAQRKKERRSNGHGGAETLADFRD